MTMAQVSKSINKAILFWKRDFLVQGPRRGGYFYDFKKTACSVDTKLTFQFGILDNEQRKRIADPQKYGGLAIRTSANTENGTGFIYISPEKGELKYNVPHVEKNVWSKYGSGILDRVIAHEFSHVLGFNHLNGHHLLSEKAVLETMQSAKKFYEVDLMDEYGFVFRKLSHEINPDYCGEFGIKKCDKLKFDVDTERLKISYKNHKSDVWKILGTGSIGEIKWIQSWPVKNCIGHLSCSYFVQVLSPRFSVKLVLEDMTIKNMHFSHEFAGSTRLTIVEDSHLKNIFYKYDSFIY